MILSNNAHGMRVRGVRGLGTACGTITNALCNSGAVTSVDGVLCSSCVEPAPVVTQSTPTLPTGYDLDTGLISPANTVGQTGVTDYGVSYPNNPGGGSSANDDFDSAGCDLTAQSWLDVGTWCSSRWVEVALGGALLLVLLTVGVGGRR